MYIYRGKLSLGSNAANEAFALIIPMQFKYNDPIYAMWRWTTSPDGTPHAPCCNASTIESIRVTSRDVGTTTYVAFRTTGNRYAFEGDFKGTDAQDTMNLLMQDVTTSDSANISLKLRYSSAYTPLPSYKIYAGCFSYASLAVEELMIVVFPKEARKGANVCTYWQWTKSENNSGDMANVNNKTVIKSEGVSPSNPHEIVLKFPALHGRYSIEARINEDTDILLVDIRINDKNIVSDDTGKGIVLQRVALPASTVDSNDSGKTLKKRSAESKIFGRNTSAIVNDTKNPVYCILTESADGNRSQNIALAGVAIAAIGVIPFFMEGAAATIASAGIAGIGGELALVGLWDAFVSNAGPVINLLFEGDVLYRTSSASVPLNADNDVILYVMSVKDRTFAVKFATKQSLGEKAWKVSELVKSGEGGEGGKKSEWTPLINFKLPLDFHLKSFRLLRVPKFVVSLPGGKTVTADKLEVNHGTMFMKTADDSNAAIVYERLSLQGLHKDAEIMKFNPSKAFMLADGGGGHASADYELMMPFQGHTYRLLLLQKCKISAMDQKYAYLGNPVNESAVLTKIQSAPGYTLYYWNKNLPNTQFRGLDDAALAGIKVIYSGDADDYVYLPVVEWSPFQKFIAGGENADGKEG